MNATLGAGWRVPIMLIAISCGPAERSRPPDAAPVLAPSEAFCPIDTVELRSRGEEVIGAVADIAVGRTTVAVVDPFQINVKLFTTTGDLLEVLGRAGNGPGEFRMPWRIAAASSGTLFILDIGRGVVSTWGEDGTWHAEWRPGGLMRDIGLVALDTVVVLTGRLMADRRLASPFGVHEYTLDGAHVTSYRGLPPQTRQPHLSTFEGMSFGTVGDVVVSGIMRSNEIHHFDRMTKRQWSTHVGDEIYEPITWPEERLSRAALTKWVMGKMFLGAIVPLPGRGYLLQFYQEPSQGDVRYAYAIADANGATQLQVTSTPLKIAHADEDGILYGTITHELGAVSLVRLRLANELPNARRLALCR